MDTGTAGRGPVAAPGARRADVRADDLRPLLSPRSIAVVGASASPGKAGNAMVRSLLGFPGALHLINPRATEIEGRPAVPSVQAIGAPVDLAVLVVPAEGVPAVLEDCGAAGVRAAVICAGGFAEIGGGRALQDEALAVARRHGMRLLGPNTSGFMNPVDRVLANFVPHVTGLEPGHVSIVTSSGGVNLAASFLAGEDGAGLRLGVGLGNAADVGFAEVLDFLAADEVTRAVALHIEGVDDGRALVAAVARLAAEKPVVALKVGRSDVGDIALSHTGRLLGDFAVARAALRQAGAVVVDDLGELVDAVRALALRRLPPIRDPGVGVVTGQAGPGLLITDHLQRRGVTVPDLTASTRQGLDRLLPPLTWLRNPVDTGRPVETFARVLALVARDEVVDGLLVYALEEGGAVDPEAVLRTPGVAGGLPVVFGTGGPRAELDRHQRALAELGVPLYRSPERAARAMGALVEDARARFRRGEAVVRAVRVGADSELAGRANGPDGGESVGSAVGAPEAEVPPPAPTGVPVVERDGALDEHGAKALLEAVGVATPARRACATRAAAHDALAALGAPVVVKVLDAAIAHKAEVGGVHLGVTDPAALDAALDALDAIDAIPGSGIRAYLVEAQAAAGVELLVGGFRDVSFGPVVALGRGGSDVDRNGPPALRLAPLSAGDAAELVADVDADVDVDAVGPVLRAVGALLLADPGIVEVDVNPLRLTPGGPVALDALVVRRRAEPGDG